jgi:branched-chain amino acid transport system ATP-binding protein
VLGIAAKPLGVGPHLRLRAKTADPGMPDERPGGDAQNVIETIGLTKEFKGFVAVKNVNLKIKRNTVHSLIGPNGAGKTTCFNLITKFLEPTSGTIKYNARDVTKAKPAEVSRMGMVRSFQISSTFPHLTVLENVRVALQRATGTQYHFWKSENCLSSLNARAVELIESVGLGSYTHRTAAELSYGRKRALEIATTLALDPEVLLLDEPTSGMGHEDVGSITDLIQDLAANRTVVLVEHNLSVVCAVSDFITVLARGEVLAEGDYAHVSKCKEVVSAYMGNAHA